MQYHRSKSYHCYTTNEAMTAAGPRNPPPHHLHHENPRQVLGGWISGGHDRWIQWTKFNGQQYWWKMQKLFVGLWWVKWLCVWPDLLAYPRRIISEKTQHDMGSPLSPSGMQHVGNRWSSPPPNSSRFVHFIDYCRGANLSWYNSQFGIKYSGSKQKNDGNGRSMSIDPRYLMVDQLC